MKRIIIRIIIASIMILSVFAIFVGKISWDKKVEVTVKEAEEKIYSPQYKEKFPYLQQTNKQSDEETPNQQPSQATNHGQQEKANNENRTETHTNSGNIVDQTPEENPDVNTSEKPKYTLDEIREAYYQLFSELEAQETSRIDQLVIEAKAEFVSSNVPIETLITKYEGLAREMEKNADLSFQYIYEQMQIDLERNGYDKEALAEFKDIYAAKKRDRLQRVIEQLEDF